MKLADEDGDAELEAGAPLVHALLGLAESLDDLQQRMLTFHHDSRKTDRVQISPPRSAAGGAGGWLNL